LTGGMSAKSALASIVSGLVWQDESRAKTVKGECYIDAK